ncbi:MAG: serine hydrolase domain-containing protein [Ornithinimicrobium sp.]
MNTTHLLRRLAMPKVAGVGAQLMTAATCAVLVLSSMLGPTAALAESRVPIGSTQDSMIEPAETALADQLAASRIPGGAVVVAGNGQVEARGVGSAGDGSDVDPDTPFVLGSTSKSFTALAVMQLVDSGTVDLEDAVTGYVPELDLAAGEPVEDITVRHLLQHTSGLSDRSAGPVVGSAAEGTPLDAVSELRGATLISPPGKQWHYANVNYVLAGLIVERASGVSYSDYIHHWIFSPLNMDHSYVSADAARADSLSQGHQYWFGLPVSAEPRQPDAMLAAGYLISTPTDIGRYLNMYLSEGLGPDGRRIVSPEGLRTMLTPGPEARLGTWAQGTTSHYAMGWFVGGPWSPGAPFHPGNSPDSSSMIALFPDRGVAVATLLNAGHELPVPGNPSITDRVSRNVIHAALGQDVVDLPSMVRFYLFFDAVAFALIALAVWGLVRALTSLPAARNRTPSTRVIVRSVGVAVRAFGALGLGLGVSLLYGWAQLRIWAPDLFVATMTLILLWAATAVVRLVILTRTRRKTASPTARAAAA